MNKKLVYCIYFLCNLVNSDSVCGHNTRFSSVKKKYFFYIFVDKFGYWKKKLLKEMLVSSQYTSVGRIIGNNSIQFI
jgi:hypothetical protein